MAYEQCRRELGRRQLREFSSERYFFHVTAADNTPLGSKTTDYFFETKVQEVKPEIDHVTYTDVNNPATTLSTAVITDPANPAVVIVEKEDQALTIDFRSNDEQQETTDGSFQRDSYYSIFVTRPDGSNFTLSTNATIDSTPAEPGLDAGGLFAFLKDTGRIGWTPNNRDVGTWTIQATHFDGQGMSDPVTVQVVVENTLLSSMRHSPIPSTGPCSSWKTPT